MSVGIATRVRQALIFAHRWLGVVLCLLFLIWFPSGIVMMYWEFPSVSDADRLDRSPVLDPSTIHVSPLDAAISGAPQPPSRILLNTFDGRPVYRFVAGRTETIVYADTGDPQREVSKGMVDRIAAAWTHSPAAQARVELLDDLDQWTIQAPLQAVKPLWKYSWPDGQQVYVSQADGEIVQYTNTGSRLAAYFGAIPHWLYFKPLRKHGLQWSRFVIWSSGIATCSALLGIVIGIWMYSPSRRYRHEGARTSIPYRGQKRWHMILGLVFGLGAATWAFSGMLSLDPFPTRQGSVPPSRSRIAQALRGRMRLPPFTPKSPLAALTEISDLGVKQLEFVIVAGQPAYVASLSGGGTRIVPVDGPPRAEFSRTQLVDALTEAAKPEGLTEIRVLDHYDRYYLDRHHEAPLPVILARVNETAQTRFYIDPKTGRIVAAYDAGTWMARWLYRGLHSLDFPWLYEYRPLWDIVVITFMLGGTALCVTSLILAWRVLGRKLRGAASRAAFRELALAEDLRTD